MNIAEQIFLFAAQEQGISHAAERACVSQQCASKHIQNLESRYGVSLIIRKPHFMLTEAGNALYHTLQQIYMLESETRTRIEEIRLGETGHLSLGINSSRVKILLPPVLARYRQLYPNVQITIRLDDSLRLIDMMLRGDVDLAVSINTSSDPRFSVIPLLDESVYFVATRRLVQEYNPDVLHGSMQHALHLQDITRFPLCMNLPGSTLVAALEACAARNNVVLNPVLRCSDYSIQLELCRAGAACFFCPESLLPAEACRLDTDNTAENTPLYFEIPELYERLYTELIRPAGAVQPAYIDHFAQEIRDYYSSMNPHADMANPTQV